MPTADDPFPTLGDTIRGSLLRPKFAFGEPSDGHARDPSEMALGKVHAWLLGGPDDLALIDAGYPGQIGLIELGIKEAGFRLEDLRHVVVTHAHPDHVGSLAEVRRRVPHVRVYAHRLEADLMVEGRTKRPELAPAPGPLHRTLFELFVRNSPHAVEPVAVDETIDDGDELPFAGGLRVVHTPGHAAGHVSLHRPEGPHGRGFLFVGDAAMRLTTLDVAICYEDFAEGTRSLAKLAALDFDVATFGHGRAITRDASSAFRRFVARRGFAND